MKKGFTLMELLLVVAVLAIVAAAAAPTFFGGAKEAMDEARKSSFMSAYQNCISGTNLLMGIAASQGKVPTADATPLKFIDANNIEHSLAEYAPLAARVCTNKAGASYVFTATYNATREEVVVSVVAGTADPTSAGTEISVKSTNNETGKDTVELALLDAWATINGESAGE